MIQRLHLSCIIFKLCHKLDRNSMNELMLFIEDCFTKLK